MKLSKCPTERSIKYYYIRNSENKPIITICLLKIGKQLSRGIAICSDEDNPCKKTGRNIAIGRAHKAMFAEKCSCKINRHFVLLKWRFFNGYDIDIRKSVYSPILTDFERKLL